MIDISELMRRLAAKDTSPEDLVACALRNLYSLECNYAVENKLVLRNSIRACVAYVKLLYDYGQLMGLARAYLLHRIKVLEVREDDLKMEKSMLRGITPPLRENVPQNNILSPRIGKKSGFDGQDSDQELDIILDTRMIQEINKSELILLDINRRLKEKKSVLEDLEQEMEQTSSTLLTSVDLSISPLEMDIDNIDGSSRVERTQVFKSTNRPRDGGARITLPIDTKMEMEKENELYLPSQGAHGISRGRHGGTPVAAASSSGKSTVEAVSGSALAAQAATAERCEAISSELRISEGCTLMIEAQGVEEQVPVNVEEKSQAQRVKRKALVSQGAVSPSREELEKSHGRKWMFRGCR